MRRLPLLAPIALAACVDVEPDTSVTSEDIISPLREPQGRSFFGSNLDNLAGRYANVKFSASDQVLWHGTYHALVVTDACLALESAPSVCLDFNAMGVTPKMTGSTGEELRILDAQPFVGPGPIPNAWRYKVRRIINPSSFENLCTGPTSTGYAFPIAGEWTTTGVHINSTDRISWACEDDGVAGKAVQWGSTAGSTAHSAAWIEHEVAVRMGRADYCYNGQAHTIDGTEIGIYDNTTLPFDGAGHPLPVVNGLTLEAAWPPSLAAGGGGSALCFSKARWSTLGFGDQCSGMLKDPRNPENSGSKFCEDWTIAELTLAGAILYNTSAYNDLGIYRWSLGTDTWSTVQGFVAKTTGAGNIPPAPGFAFVRREANLLSDAGRTVFINNNQFVASDFVAVNTYLVAGDHVLTTVGKVPAGGTILNTEGFLWKSRPTGLPPEMVPVELFRFKKGNDYLTTVDVAGAVATGYTNQVSLGWGLVSH